MKNPSNGLLSQIHLWTDLVLLNTSTWIAFSIHRNLTTHDFGPVEMNVLLVSNLLWILSVYFLETYSFPQISFPEVFNRLFWKFLPTTGLYFFCEATYIFFSGQAEMISTKLVLNMAVIFVSSAVLTRILFLLLFQFYQKTRHNFKSYAVIGEEDLANMIKNFYKERKELGYRFCGAFQFKNSGNNEIEKLEDFIRTEQPDYLYCCLANMNNEQVREVIKLAERKKTNIRLMADSRSFTGYKAKVEYRNLYSPIIHVDTNTLPNSNELFAKRLFDILSSLIVIILGSPIFLTVIAAIRFSSSGPVFSLQERIGRGGKPFKLIKFNTSPAGGQENVNYASEISTSQLTPLNKLICKSGIDELPQFFNVLKGDMSVVGPLPVRPFDAETLNREAGHDFQKVLMLRPGITSIGQLKIGYSTSIRKSLLRLSYDVRYLDKYSFLTDVYLIFRSIKVMLAGKKDHSF